MIYNIKLHILSPIHIGCDESYSPLEFIIDADKNLLIHFNLWQFIENLDNKDWQKLKTISENISLKTLVEIYRFYSELKSKIKGETIPIPTELAERYRKVKQLSKEREILKEFNQFEIPRTYFNPYTQRPIIPGSSLKGSLRTGYLSGIRREFPEKEKIKDKKSDELEEILLGGKMGTDPFRFFKVSDFESQNNVKTKIMYQVNVHKLKNQSRQSLSVPLEVIPEGNVFEATVKVDIPLQNSGIRKPINFKELLLKVHSHYAGIFNKEIDLRKQKGFRMPNVSSFSPLKQKFFLIRLGKHSGAEAVTIEGVRNIRVRTKEGFKNQDSPTTIWLASEEKKLSNLSRAIPFGWVMLEVVNADKL